ncbi:MAG: grdX [Firmicutes bacterium]|nr:grdX [Bacillota bacterium]
MKIIVTNNPQARDFFHKKNLAQYYELCWVQGFTENVLLKVRDLCHTNHQLLTHPLIGSIKPNQTPYKTILVEKTSTISNIDSILMAEASLMKTLALLESCPRPQSFTLFLDDFASIDLDFLKIYLQGG